MTYILLICGLIFILSGLYLGLKNIDPKYFVALVSGIVAIISLFGVFGKLYQDINSTEKQNKILNNSIENLSESAKTLKTLTENLMLSKNIDTTTSQTKKISELTGTNVESLKTQNTELKDKLIFSQETIDKVRSENIEKGNTIISLQQKAETNLDELKNFINLNKMSLHIVFEFDKKQNDFVLEYSKESLSKEYSLNLILAQEIDNNFFQVYLINHATWEIDNGMDSKTNPNNHTYLVQEESNFIVVTNQFMFNGKQGNLKGINKSKSMKIGVLLMAPKNLNFNRMGKITIKFASIILESGEILSCSNFVEDKDRWLIGEIIR